MRNKEVFQVDAEMKDKYLKRFQEEIINQRLKKDEEKKSKIQEEKDYLSRIRREIEMDKISKQLEKQQIINYQLNDYKSFLEQKKIEERRKLEEKLYDKSIPSLSLNSDERMNQFKTYISKLDENIAKNMEYHKKYLDENQRNQKSLQLTSGESTKDKNLQIDNSNFENNTLQVNDNANVFELNQNESNLNQRLEDSKNYNVTEEAKLTNSVSEQNNFLSNTNSGTNKNSIDFNEINNRNLKEYQNVKRDYLNYNQNIINNKLRSYELFMEEKRKIAEERIKEGENSYLLELELKRNKQDQQKIYKNMLDGQYHDRIQVTSPIKSNINKNLSNIVDDHSYLYKNHSYTVAPYSEKRYEIGSTFLNHNPIVNPVPNYRDNKYLYREAPRSALRTVANNIIG